MLFLYGSYGSSSFSSIGSSLLVIQAHGAQTQGTPIMGTGVALLGNSEVRDLQSYDGSVR